MGLLAFVAARCVADTSRHPDESTVHMSYDQVSEKSLYLEALRQRCVLFMVCAPASADAMIAPVLDELAANTTRTILVHAGPRQRFARGSLPAGERPAEVYRELRASGRVEVCCSAVEEVVDNSTALTIALGIKKLVVVLPSWPEGAPSFLSSRKLELPGDDGPTSWLDEGLATRLIEAAAAGVEAINLCSAQQLYDELFTYQGAGTLISPRVHASVRPLGIDDLDRAYDLIRRGTDEGYLAPRSVAQLDALLECLLGVFVGDVLCGVASCRRYVAPEGGADWLELGTLYTISRFKGGGLGSRLVEEAVARAQGERAGGMFACTISDAVAGFFEQHGFERVPGHRLPPEKWQDYAQERRSKVIVLEYPLSEGSDV